MLTNEAFWGELTDIKPENIIHGSLSPLPTGEEVYLILDPMVFPEGTVYQGKTTGNRAQHYIIPDLPNTTVGQVIYDLHLPD